MRVIAGNLRRRQLKEVMSETTRSTKDRVKESLFNALTPLERFDNVLDAFAGSGALGIEALSRGANTAVFIEKDFNAFNILKENINALALDYQSTLFLDNTLSVLKHTEDRFDLILLDPPYETNLVEESLKIIHTRKLLNDNGLIAILSAKNNDLSIDDVFFIKKQKAIGITNVTLLEWSE